MGMERRGILSVEPSHAMLPAEEDAFSRALKVSGSIYDIMGKHYENKYKNAQARNQGLEADRKQGTLASDIQAANTKNQTDIQYYPQLQAMELAKQGATIKEIQAKTGLSYAEAGAARARASASYAEANKTNMNASPVAYQQELYKQYANSAPGSREQLYYGGLLKAEMGKYGSPVGGVPTAGSNMTTSVPGTPQGGTVPVNTPGWEKDTKFGSTRMGAGGTYIDPQTGKTISTPTNSTTSRNQSSIQALQRVTPLIEDLSKNISQFQTVGQKGNLALQTAGNLLGGNYTLPNQKAEALQDLALAPESLLKAYQLNVTDQSLKTMENAIKPITGETTKGYQGRLVKTLKTLKENEEAAKKVQAEGIDVTQPGAQGQPIGQQYQDPFYDNPNPPKSNVAQGFNGNPNVQNSAPGDAFEMNGQHYAFVNGKWVMK